ncbi:MAG: YihY/virulence factor BrkB family protein [Streptosporangiaceae bacterium]
MVKVIDRARRGFDSAHLHGVGVLRRRRATWSWLDHLGRAYARYRDQHGDQMAAALTFFAFLSFFPLLAVAYALLGYAAGRSEEFRQYLIDAINEALPGLGKQLNVTEIAKASAGVGVIGLVALGWAGLGWVGALRTSIRALWAQDPDGAGNFALVKLRDLLALLFLGLMLMGSVAATTVTSTATTSGLELIGLDEGPGVSQTIRLLAVAVGLFFNTMIYLVLFTRLSGTNAHWRHVFKGALMAAVGFETLKILAAVLVGHTTRNPVYAGFAVLVGLLVWMNLVSRMTFYAAAWTATRSKVLSYDEPGHAEPDAA